MAETASGNHFAGLTRGRARIRNMQEVSHPGVEWRLVSRRIPTASIEYRNLGVNLLIVSSYQNRLYGALSLQSKLRVF